MHYPDWAFSTNGKPTIEAVGSAIGAEIGQRDGMTAGDIKQVNKFYECAKSSGSGSGNSITQILKRGIGGNKGGQGGNETKEDTGSNGGAANNGDAGNNEGAGNNGGNGNQGEKKPLDKKGGKCEAQFNEEQKNKAKKMARKEELMRQQHENMKRRAEEEKLAGMLKRKKKH